MDELNLLRKEINSVDEQIKELFLKRLDLVLKISKEKNKLNLPIFDAKREKEIKARLTNDINKEFLPYYLSFIEHILLISKQYQENLLKGDVYD